MLLRRFGEACPLFECATADASLLYFFDIEKILPDSAIFLMKLCNKLLR